LGELKVKAHFQEKVLNIAEREINNKTDITINFELIKESRKFTKIGIFVKRKKQIILENDKNSDMTNGDDSLSLVLVSYGFTKKAATTLISRYSVARVEAAILKIKKKIKDKVFITSIPALLTTIVKSHITESGSINIQHGIYKSLEKDSALEQDAIDKNLETWTEIESFCTKNSQRIERLYLRHIQHEVFSDDDDLFKHELYMFTELFPHLRNLSRLIPTMFIDDSPRKFKFVCDLVNRVCNLDTSG
jgi:hypothetical protein